VKELKAAAIRGAAAEHDVLELKSMIQEHVAYTNSEKGKRILDHFSEYLPKFKKIVPHDYRRMMNAIVQMEEKGLIRRQILNGNRRSFHIFMTEEGKKKQQLNCLVVS